MKLALRMAGVVLLIVVGALHLYLWGHDDYRAIPTIGPLFMLTVVASWLLALALLVRGHLALALAGALFALATLGAYVLSLTVGIFNFTEPSVSLPGALSIASEAGAAAALLAWGVLDRWASRSAPRRSAPAVVEVSRGGSPG